LRASFGWVVAACVLGAVGCGAEPGTGPNRPPVPPGLYVLSDVGGMPAPYVYEEATYSDSVVATLSFAFDSVHILNDSAFTRHFRRELVITRPPIPPIVQEFDEFRFSGIILDREDEIKLTVTSGVLPGGHDLAYFTPVAEDPVLLRHTTVRRYQCTATRCDLISEQRVISRYARQ